MLAYTCKAITGGKQNVYVAIFKKILIAHF